MGILGARRAVAACLAVGLAWTALPAGAESEPVAAPRAPFVAHGTGWKTIGGYPARIEVAFLVRSGESVASATSSALAQVGASVQAPDAPLVDPVVGLHWPQFYDGDPTNDSVPFRFNDAGAPFAGLGDLLSPALATWSAVTGSTYRATLAGTTTAGDTFDRVNMIGWDLSGSTGGTVLGYTSGIYDPDTNALLDTDIVFNRATPWSLTGAADGYDLPTTVLHELGHATGLFDHSFDPTQAMYGVLSLGVQRRELGAEDEARLRALYPQRTFAAAGTNVATHRSFVGSLGAFTDSVPRPASAYQVSINWGDGSPTSAATLSPRDLGGFDIGGMHLFTKVGTFTVRSTVTGPGGTVVATSTATVKGILPTSCVGTVSLAVVPSDIEVAAAAPCRLLGTRVAGSALVAKLGVLSMRGGSVDGEVVVVGGRIELKKDAAGRGTRIGRGVTALAEKSIFIAGATIGTDLAIATTGSDRSVFNVICATTIGRDLGIVGIPSTSRGYILGGYGFYSYWCGAAQGNTIGRDTLISGTGYVDEYSQSPTVFVMGNTFRRDLVCLRNSVAPAYVPGEPKLVNTVGRNTSPACRPLTS